MENDPYCCYQCFVDSGISFMFRRMFLCPICGNKRCPKATNHLQECTNSNDTDQMGSIYGNYPVYPVKEN
jgi:hypothetical protein